MNSWAEKINNNKSIKKIVFAPHSVSILISICQSTTKKR